MNKMRRKELSDVIRELSTIQDRDDLASCINTLDNIKDDEQYYYDNIPENLQSSQRAEDSERAIEYMEEALDLLNEVCDADEFNPNSEEIHDAIDKIENAIW